VRCAVVRTCQRLQPACLAAARQHDSATTFRVNERHRDHWLCCFRHLGTNSWTSLPSSLFDPLPNLHTAYVAHRLGAHSSPCSLLHWRVCAHGVRAYVTLQLCDRPSGPAAATFRLSVPACHLATPQRFWASHTVPARTRTVTLQATATKNAPMILLRLHRVCAVAT